MLYYIKEACAGEDDKELRLRKASKPSVYEVRNFAQSLVLSVGKGFVNKPDQVLYAEALPERVQWVSGAVWAEGGTLCDPWDWHQIVDRRRATPARQVVDLSCVVDSPMKSLSDLSAGCVKRRRVDL